MGTYETCLDTIIVEVVDWTLMVEYPPRNSVIVRIIVQAINNNLEML